MTFLASSARRADSTFAVAPRADRRVLSPVAFEDRWRDLIGACESPTQFCPPSIRDRKPLPKERHITIGIDPHKQTHTAVAVNEAGQLLGEVTVSGDEAGQRDLLTWAQGLEGAGEHRFALEDCRHVNGRLERFLLASGEAVLRVPPSLMAGARKSARTRGKSDAIDALAIARAALREGAELHPASYDEAARELKLLVDHRDALVSERTGLASRLR